MGHVIFIILHIIAFLFGLVFLFITIPLHIIYAVIVNKDKEQITSEKIRNRICPFCGETILKIAIVCKHCGKDLEKVEEEVEIEDCPKCKHYRKRMILKCLECGKYLKE